MLDNRITSKIQLQKDNVKRTVWVKESSIFIEDELPKDLITHQSVILQAPRNKQQEVILYDKDLNVITAATKGSRGNKSGKRRIFCGLNKRNYIICIPSSHNIQNTGY